MPRSETNATSRTDQLVTTNNVSRAPHSYYKELAQMGSLYEFLTTFMYEEFQANNVFRKEMLFLMLDNAEGSETEIEYELLCDMRDALQHFLDKMKLCNHTLH